MASKSKKATKKTTKRTAPAKKAANTRSSARTIRVTHVSGKGGRPVYLRVRADGRFAGARYQERHGADPVQYRTVEANSWKAATEAYRAGKGTLVKPTGARKAGVASPIAQKAEAPAKAARKAPAKRERKASPKRRASRKAAASA